MIFGHTPTRDTSSTKMSSLSSPLLAPFTGAKCCKLDKKSDNRARCNESSWSRPATSTIATTTTTAIINHQTPAHHKGRHRDRCQDNLDTKTYHSKLTAKLNLVCNQIALSQSIDRVALLAPNKVNKISAQTTSPPTRRRQQQQVQIKLGFVHLLIQLVCLHQQLTRNIKESLASAVPNFLDSGHPIPCKIGQPVEISDYIPFSDPSLKLCINCSCPNGTVSCVQSTDPGCSIKVPLGGAGPMKLPPSGVNRFAPSPNAGGNRVSPTTLTHHQHGYVHHHHHHHHSKSPIGKAKTFGVPRKPTKTSTTGNGQHQPNAAALVQPRQQRPTPMAMGRNVVQSSRLSSSRGRQQQPVDPEDEQQETIGSEASAIEDDLPEVGPVVSSFKMSRSFQSEPELLQSPRIPIDDPRHHAAAAEILGMKFIEKRNKLLKEQQQARTSTTQLVETTATTTTTTTPLPTTIEEEISTQTNQDEEAPLEENNGETSNPFEEDSEPATDLSGPLTEIDQSTITTLQSTPESTIGTTEDWPLTTEIPSQTSEWPSNNDLDRDLIERDPAIITHEGQKILIKPGLESIGRTFDSSRNKIDYNSANDVMEQVSRDGMLYIAIGVEAFILLSIIAMMIIFYFFRYKTPEELDHHQVLQMPSRSPSLDKA